MSMPFESSTTFEHSPDCVVRPQEDGFLIYNSRTDELHLVSRLGHYIYELCDGTRDVATIEAAFGSATDGTPSVLGFIQLLASRGILKGVNYD
ncbi:MAG TPA: PqqD family protein [Polyangiaceae bacterium]|nr:PqqD family protein [Polyangiaceae bacterium]